MIKGKRKKEKGITLLALVVTIIILLILAAVALNLSLQDGGVLDEARYAVNEWNRGEQEEKEELSKVGNELKNIREENSNKNRKIITFIITGIKLEAYEGETLLEWAKRTDLTKIEGVTEVIMQMKEYSKYVNPEEDVVISYDGSVYILKGETTEVRWNQMLTEGIGFSWQVIAGRRWKLRIMVVL